MTLVATQVKRRRGTNDENDVFAGAEGEITVDLTNKELRVHDGSGKTGGFRIGRHTDRGNCTIEVPQNIKLELSNGTLTLKAGSKVYVPNGFQADGTTPRFDVIIIENDISQTISFNGTCTVVYHPSLNSMYFYSSAVDLSGSTDPSATATFYNTAQNIMKRFDGSSLTRSGFSFPIARVVTTTSGVQSIVEVSNGIGHIGSTRFVLPDVIALAPNGRNADGTPKNIVCKSSSVWVSTSTDGTAKIVMFGNLGLATNRCLNTNYFVQKTEPITNSVLSWWYNPETNIISKYDGTKWVAGIWVELAQYDTTSSIIRNMSVKTVFRAVDYNDTEYMAHQAMPSDRYLDLTAGASGTTYTAPADGYLVARATATATGKYLELIGGRMNSLVHSGAGSLDLSVYIPVQKGTIVTMYYSTNTPSLVRFIYTQGSK